MDHELSETISIADCALHKKHLAIAIGSILVCVPAIAGGFYALYRLVTFLSN